MTFNERFDRMLEELIARFNLVMTKDSVFGDRRHSDKTTRMVTSYCWMEEKLRELVEFGLSPDDDYTEETGSVTETLGSELMMEHYQKLMELGEEFKTLRELGDKMTPENLARYNEVKESLLEDLKLFDVADTNDAMWQNALALREEEEEQSCECC